MTALQIWQLVGAGVVLATVAGFAFTWLNQRDQRLRARLDLERDAQLRAEKAAAAVLEVIEQPASWWESKRRHQVMVHLNDDSTMRGLVLEVAPDGVLLGAAEYLGDRSTPLGGEVFVPKEMVTMVQVPPGAAREGVDGGR